MAKEKKPKNILHECIKCNSSIESNSKLHCKIKILDMSKPFTVYSEVTTKIDCGYYRERR